MVGDGVSSGLVPSLYVGLGVGTDKLPFDVGSSVDGTAVGILVVGALVVGVLVVVVGLGVGAIVTTIGLAVGEGVGSGDGLLVGDGDGFSVGEDVADVGTAVGLSVVQVAKPPAVPGVPC